MSSSRDSSISLTLLHSRVDVTRSPNAKAYVRKYLKNTNITTHTHVRSHHHHVFLLLSLHPDIHVHATEVICDRDYALQGRQDQYVNETGRGRNATRVCCQRQSLYHKKRNTRKLLRNCVNQLRWRLIRISAGANRFTATTLAIN